MYKLKFKPMEKTAGTKVPSDPKMWPAEILKALVTNHPYVDTSQIKVRFHQLEPESDIAAGIITVANKAAIPFTVRKNQSKRTWDLDSMDVLFDGERFCHLNESSLRSAMDSQQVGQPVDKKQLPPPNEYAGDLTGDVTPLEWSGYPTGFAGPRSVSAGIGLLSYVVKNQQTVSQLQNLLTSYHGLNSAAAELGLSDSLDALNLDLVETQPRKRLAHIMKKRGGGFAIAFDGGDTRAISIKDLRRTLGGDFAPVMRQVNHRGWAFIRDFPEVRDSDVTAIGIVPGPIDIGGQYRVFGLDGTSMTSIVCSEMVDFDGSRIANQKVLCRDGHYAEGKKFVGVPVPAMTLEPKQKLVQERLVYEHKPYAENLMFPTGVMDVGSTGCFVDESWGSPKATPTIQINQIIEVPGEPDHLICTRLDTKEQIGLVVLPSLVRPQEIPHDHRVGDLLPSKSYYFPAHMSWVPCVQKVALMDKAVIAHSKEAEQRPTAELHKNANRYSLTGKAVAEDLHFAYMDEVEMRQKLAWYGASDDAIQDACHMKEGERKALHGLRGAKFSLKKEAKQNVLTELDFAPLRKAAADAADGLDQALQTKNNEDLKDPKMLDNILALQFVSEDSLQELVESDDLFKECEDKLAKLLMASRQGEKSIHEKGVKKALQGIGEARKSLKELSMVLEAQ